MVPSAVRGIQVVSITAPQQIIQRNIPTLERKIDEAIAEKPETVDLVLSAVQIADSLSLNWLLSVQARLETLGIRLRLVNPSTIMSDILLATRLDSRLTVEVIADAGKTGSGASAIQGDSNGS